MVRIKPGCSLANRKGGHCPYAVFTHSNTHKGSHACTIHISSLLCSNRYMSDLAHTHTDPHTGHKPQWSTLFLHQIILMVVPAHF